MISFQVTRVVLCHSVFHSIVPCPPAFPHIWIHLIPFDPEWNKHKTSNMQSMDCLIPVDPEWNIWNIQTVGSMKITFIFTVGWFTQQQNLLKMYNLSALKTLHAPVWIIPNHINFLPCLLHINYSSSLHPSFTWSHIHCNQYNYAFVPFVFHFRKLKWNTRFLYLILEN